MDMQNIPKRWKIVGAGTALAALGIAGFGFADNGDRLSLPDAIQLRDSVPVTEAAGDLAAPAFKVVPAPIVGVDDSLSSPFDTVASASPDSPPAAPPTGVADDSVSLDSPENFSPDSVDAPAQEPMPAQSLDSPDSFSPDSIDTPAAQPAPGQSFDSPESLSNDSFSDSFDSDSLTS
jgi:hypothetical protein